MCKIRIFGRESLRLVSVLKRRKKILNGDMLGFYSRRSCMPLQAIIGGKRPVMVLLAVSEVNVAGRSTGKQHGGRCLSILPGLAY